MSASSKKPDEIVSPRTIVLCFDGTGNKFGENSNVVRFFKSLVKDQPERQVVYYQPGIGTYNQRQFFTHLASTVASTIDQGIALHLNDHVKEGYEFIMQNYRKGDKICLFGFSRGAHTARVVAGMLYKVGLLPPHNIQQLDFAYSVYQTTGSHGVELSKEFKRTFALPVTVEFVGVWDTVSSVGIIPQSHPYTSVNYAVKTFRHALALDERRARFRPQTWNEPTLEQEQDLDVDDPKLLIKHRGNIPRDEWEYEPPDRTTTNVKEVWFAGAHADVGGGSHPNTEPDSLSFIPLRWMFKECILADTGILFDHDSLVSYGFDFNALEKALAERLAGNDVDAGSYEKGQVNGTTHPITNGTHYSPPGSPLNSPVGSGILPEGLHHLKGRLDRNMNALSDPFDRLPTTNGIHTSANMPGVVEHVSLLHRAYDLARRLKERVEHDVEIAIQHALDPKDCVATIYDQLVHKWWWTLEILPMLTTYQREDGTWVRRRVRNFGGGRYIPYTDAGRIFIHTSVKDRMAAKKEEYKPAAANWDIVKDSTMLVWVS